MCSFQGESSLEVLRLEFDAVGFCPGCHRISSLRKTTTTKKRILPHPPKKEKANLKGPTGISLHRSGFFYHEVIYAPS